MESGQLNYTWFGKAKQLVRVGVSGTEHFDNIDYFWDHAYQKINTISVSSWILFFIIFYLIATYIKYSLKHSKDKSSTYKQVLKDKLILVITTELSIIFATFVYSLINWNNPFPATKAITRDEVLLSFGILALNVFWILFTTLYIILRQRENSLKNAVIYSLKFMWPIIFIIIIVFLFLCLF